MMPYFYFGGGYFLLWVWWFRLILSSFGIYFCVLCLFRERREEGRGGEKVIVV